MIASPSDVTEERQIIREVISDWNIVHSESRQTVLLPVGWETHSYPEMGEHPQTLLNKQILRDCDLLVGVFWTRIGTATPNYQSGTVEEIEEHLKANKPALLYFSGKPLPQNFDSEQWNLLQQFKNNCQSRGLYQTYSDTQQFRELFSRHLQLKLNQFIPNKSQNLTEPNSTQPNTAKQILSSEAQKLLKECSKSDNGMIFRRELNELSKQLELTSNSKEFIGDNSSPRTVAMWEEAIKQLESNGLIKDQTGNWQIFKITHKGYEAADSIADS